MDVNMPVMDGFTATQKLRRQGLKTAIIALTANAMKGFDQECLAAGYSGYFSKPIDIDRFMKMMADLLGGHPVVSETEALPCVSHAADGDPTDIAGECQSPIFSRLPADNERFRNLIVRFTKRLNDQLDAVEQDQPEGKKGSVAAFAHWLKGAGGTVGFDEFTAPASKLEQLAKTGGSDAQIQEAIANLRNLAGRLVMPGAEPSVATRDAAKPLGKTTEENANQATQPAPATHQPVVSRLGTNPRFQEVISKFVEKLEAELRRAEMVLKDGSAQELASIAHWLKGAGGTVGFDDFTEPAAKLEKYAKAAQMEQAGHILQQVKCLSDAIVLPSIAHASSQQNRSEHNSQIASNG
jgi:HPt (histidine-containing phosphotransfer) domain-containing protein